MDARPDGQRAVRVLIVEDDAHVRRVLRRILAGVTSDVVECETGTDAARVFAETRPDVVLMDIRLPGIDGLAATREIRAATPDARVVIVTNHDEAPLRRAAAEAGAAAYVLKDGLLESGRCSPRGSPRGTASAVRHWTASVAAIMKCWLWCVIALATARPCAAQYRDRHLDDRAGPPAERRPRGAADPRRLSLGRDDGRPRPLRRRAVHRLRSEQQLRPQHQPLPRDPREAAASSGSGARPVSSGSATAPSRPTRPIDGLPEMLVTGLTGNEAGDLWVLSGERIMRWHDGRFRPEPAGEGIRFVRSRWRSDVFFATDGVQVHRFEARPHDHADTARRRAAAIQRILRAGPGGLPVDGPHRRRDRRGRARRHGARVPPPAQPGSHPGGEGESLRSPRHPSRRAGPRLDDRARSPHEPVSGGPDGGRGRAGAVRYAPRGSRRQPVAGDVQPRTSPRAEPGCVGALVRARAGRPQRLPGARGLARRNLGRRMGARPEPGGRRTHHGLHPRARARDDAPDGPRRRRQRAAVGGRPRGPERRPASARDGRFAA